MDNNSWPGIGHNSSTEIKGSRALTPADHDARNREAGQLFIRALASEKAALDQRLGLREIRVLAALTYCMSSEELRAWPSYQTLEDLTGYSERHVQHAIRALEDCGYIFRERKQRVPGGRAQVHYGLTALSLRDLDVVITEAVKTLRIERDGASSKRGQKPRAPSPLAQRIIDHGALGWGNSPSDDPSENGQVGNSDRYGIVPVRMPDQSKSAPVSSNPSLFDQRGELYENVPVRGGDKSKSAPVVGCDRYNPMSQYFYDKKKIIKGPAPNADPFRPPITIPTRLQEIVDRQKAPASIEAFMDEISAALDRGITPVTIEGALRSAVSWLESKSKTGDADCLKSCLTFLQNAKNPAERTIAPDARHAREFYAENPQLLGDIHDGGWED